MKPLRPIILLALLALPGVAQEARQADHRIEWRGTGADVTARLRERRLTEIEKRLDGIEQRASTLREEWIVARVRMDQLFYGITAVGGFLGLAIGGIALDWLRKRLKVVGNG